MKRPIATLLLTISIAAALGSDFLGEKLGIFPIMFVISLAAAVASSILFLNAGEEYGRGKSKSLDEFAKTYPGRLFQVLATFDKTNRTGVCTSALIKSTEDNCTWWVIGAFPQIEDGNWVILRFDPEGRKGRGYLEPIIMTSPTQKSSDEEEKESSAGGMADAMN